MEHISIEDLILINTLSSRTYTGLSMSSNSSVEERNRFSAIKNKLERMANHFSEKYSLTYGPFTTNVSPESNPMTRGNTLNYVWSTLFKGAANKQYSAQISFVIDKTRPCLNVGFYFGGASTHSMTNTQKRAFETTLRNLGISLANSITNNPNMLDRYNSIFDLGFTAYSNGNPVLPNRWVNIIQNEPKNCQVFAKLYPNDYGVIENSTIDFYVSQVIFLMSAINAPDGIQVNPLLNTLTPEQWAKKAERNAQIGLEGELFILRKEQEKLQQLNINRQGYPKHIALLSNHYGFDILSLDSNGNEIFIEVKTTTRKSNDPLSRKFFISNHEMKTFEENESQYKLYRVYDIENTPSCEELYLKSLPKISDGYIVEY